MNDKKTLMRAVRLAISAEAHTRAGRQIDEHQLGVIAYARNLMEQTRACDVIPAICDILDAGLQLQVDLAPPVLRKEEKSPGRPETFREMGRSFSTKKSGS